VHPVGFGDAGAARTVVQRVAQDAERAAVVALPQVGLDEVVDGGRVGGQALEQHPLQFFLQVDRLRALRHGCFQHHIAEPCVGPQASLESEVKIL
jgi:hypothetical protein